MKTLRILIAEDHEFQRMVLKQALLTLGAGTVHTAANGAEAIRILRDPDTPVDIVITDLMMPDVDGIELISMLSKTAQAVTLVVLSASQSSVDVAVEIAKGYGIPVLGALTKPIRPDQLHPLLHQYLAERAGSPR